MVRFSHLVWATQFIKKRDLTQTEVDVDTALGDPVKVWRAPGAGTTGGARMVEFVTLETEV